MKRSHTAVIDKHRAIRSTNHDDGTEQSVSGSYGAGGSV
jgi:hypothetical protein